MSARPAEPDPIIAHLPALRRLAVALVGPERSEDLVQEAALSALTSDAPRTAPALLAVVKRRAIDALRRRRPPSDLVAAEPSDRGENDPAGSAERVEAVEALMRAIGDLPGPQREAIVLCYFDGLSPARAAEQLGETPSTVRSRLQRGLAALRDQLSRGSDFRRWQACMLPIIGVRGKATAAALPTLALTSVMTIWKIGAAGAACVAIAAVVALALERHGSGTRNAPLETVQRLTELAPTPPLAGDAAEWSAGAARRSALAPSHDAEPEPGEQPLVMEPLSISGVVTLLDGTPVGADILVRAVKYEGGARSLAASAPDGTFRFAELDPGAYLLSAIPFGLTLPPPPMHVEAGAGQVELRIDAIVVQVEGLPEGHRKPVTTVATFGPATSDVPGVFYWGSFPDRLTLAAGPGYLIGAELGDASYQGVVDPGLASGSYSVLMEEHPESLGVLQLHLEGTPLKPQGHVSLRLSALDGAVRPDQSTSVRSRSGEGGRSLLGTSAVLPGRYAVKVALTERPSALPPLIGEASVDEVQIVAGSITHVTVTLRSGAGLAVQVNRGAKTVPDGADNPVGGRYQIERFDPGTDSWEKVSLQQRRRDEGWTVTLRFDPGVRLFSRALPGGEQRLRLLDGEDVVAEMTVTLVEGTVAEAIFNLPN